MLLKCHVKPGTRTEKCEQIGEGEWRVWLRAPARDGEANAALTKVVAQNFNIPKSAVRIKSGHSSRIKWVEVEADI
jgi:uncharacterized protein YggU (UPF0235/DUF167 family)